MTKEINIFALGDLAEAAQKDIQAEFPEVNPIIGINRGLRKSGFPADLMTIDDLKSRKRIILMMHDLKPDTLGFQLSTIDEDPGTQFDNWPIERVNQAQFRTWIIELFA